MSTSCPSVLSKALNQHWTQVIHRSILLAARLRLKATANSVEVFLAAIRNCFRFLRDHRLRSNRSRLLFDNFFRDYRFLYRLDRHFVCLHLFDLRFFFLSPLPCFVFWGGRVVCYKVSCLIASTDLLKTFSFFSCFFSFKSKLSCLSQLRFRPYCGAYDETAFL